jgi:hypothetical protein
MKGNGVMKKSADFNLIAEAIKKDNTFYAENFSKPTTCIKCGGSLKDCGRFWAKNYTVPVQWQKCDKCGMQTVWFLADEQVSLKIE